jgi:hypothetical protein
MMANEPGNYSAQADFKATRIIWAALIVGVAVFAIIAVFISMTSGPMIPGGVPNSSAILGILGVISLVCILIARQVYLRGIDRVKDLTEPLKEKLSQHRSLLLKYLAICEAPAILTIIFFLLSGNAGALIITGILIAAMVYVVPVKTSLISDLNIDWKEQVNF